MNTLKSLFSNTSSPKNQSLNSTFDHSNLTASDDIGQCPFMKQKLEKQGKQQSFEASKCPYNGKQNKTYQQQKQDTASSSDEEEVPKGGCPFMGGSVKKRNPDLWQMNAGYDQPFVSKFHYYLSANKIDFSALRSKKSSEPISKSREIFDNYPIYLQHTLFYNGEDYKKVRGIQCCSRFLPYEKLREKGNKYFNKGKYLEALDYYERALSLFKWLEYFQQEEKLESLAQIESQQSIQSEQNFAPVGSKVHLNMGSEQELQSAKDQFDDMKKKYKEFFVVYNDSNVRLCDGEEMEETADIDMRKSLMLQVYLNMAAAYIQLNHFSLALQCIEDAFLLSDKVSQLYLRKAQALVMNKNCSLKQAKQAQTCIQKAFKIKKHEKIFESNENILRMVNLHNADEAFGKTLDFINKRISQRAAEQESIKEKIYNRAKQIYEIEQRLIGEGKTPYQRNEEAMERSKEFKILLRMKEKYIKVLEFYTEAQNKEQIGLAKKQLQELLRVFSEMEKIINIQIEQKGEELGGVNSDKIQKRIQTIKKNYCEDIYNAGRFNFTVLEWAIKEIVKEERQQEELEAKMRAETGVQTENLSSALKPQKNELWKKASWGLVLLPIAGILINNYLLF